MIVSLHKMLPSLNPEILKDKSQADGQNRTAVDGLRNHCFATKLHRHKGQTHFIIKPFQLFIKYQKLNKL